MKTIAELTRSFAKEGQLEWIGIRHERRGEIEELHTAELNEFGVVGDHYSGSGKRAITLIQAEHLPVIGSLIEGENPAPGLLRRNLAVSDINLIGLRTQNFRIGTALLEGTGVCAPCSRMEEVLGFGGYSAMRGHGGITARVIEPGIISVGDAVSIA